MLIAKRAHLVTVCAKFYYTVVQHESSGSYICFPNATVISKSSTNYCFFNTVSTSPA